ncbi:DUF4381 domain-containing protein [Vibrio profundum]|uniref:DUF4381 domain-containing protein n=1 Tax=Vibrio profundum TaxID=2910247 RepID=UPI003D144829
MKDSASTSLLPLKPMQLPDAPSWFPLAWGWWAIMGAIAAFILCGWLIYRWNKKRLAPKRTALRLLNGDPMPLAPSDAIELLRQAALCYFPRDEIAKLTGNDWYEFLDSQLNTPRFVGNSALWQQALYQRVPIENAAVLVSDCYQWVNDALPPKRRR